MWLVLILKTVIWSCADSRFSLSKNYMFTKKIAGPSYVFIAAGTEFKLNSFNILVKDPNEIF
jgi:Gpi18-like mannosyltransferase